MGCCMSHVPPPIHESCVNAEAVSCTETTKSSELKQFRPKQEPHILYHSNEGEEGESSKKTSIEKSTSNHSDISSVDDDDEIPGSIQRERQRSEFQMKVEQRKSELLEQKQKLKELQQDAFEQQVAAQQARNFKRLYDVWQEFAKKEDEEKMDINGLTKALAVFGMIIDTDRDFQKHIFRKFDIDNEKEITYNDFSATIASFVGSNTDVESLQTLFEIFDIDQDGYLELEDMARILLAQNQIAVVVTGQQSQSNTKQVIYTKQQCLKQARRMLRKYDSDQFNDGQISFDEYKQMMYSRNENDMMIDHMQAPSISFHGDIDAVNVANL